MKKALSLLKPLGCCSVQPYFSKEISLADLIDWVILQIGAADVVISTFSTSEEFIRRLHRLKKDGKVRRCEMVCDLRAARKTVALHRFMESVFDRVYLSQNHSKVVLLSSGRNAVAIVTSQNQTRGDRFEAGIITTNEFTFKELEVGLQDCIRNHSILINDYNVQSTADR